MTFLELVRHLAVTFLLFTVSFLQNSSAQPRPVSGTHFIPRADVTPPLPKQIFKRSFRVGDPLTVPAFSFVLIGGGLYQTTTTCRHVGENAYIFVEDDVWDGTRIDQLRVDALAASFQETTPRDPDRGIYDITTDLFGAPPDVDGDPRVIIVVLDILDSPFTGSAFVGYFDTNNQSGQALREIIYIDTNPLDIESDLARATLAHEFQHMIHWRGDADEDKWIDEGCSEYAELACGYKDTTETSAETFLGSPNVSLTIWDDLPFDFDQTFLFMTYFAQRFGESAITSLVENDLNSIEGLNATLENHGGVRFKELFFDWSAANFFDSEGRLGYERIALGTVDRDTVSVSSKILRKARFWGNDFLVLDKPGQYDVTIESLGDNEVAVVLLMDAPDGPSQITIAAPANGQETVSLYSSGLKAVVVTSMSGTSEDYALSFSPGSILAGSAAAADADRNGTVDFADFLQFAGHFGSIAGRLDYNPTYDYNSDLVINFNDFLILAFHFGTKI
ncbi:MAG: hypothetical protein VX910_12445 [Candidatus Latescibacterota bacterium]|nr:hypothetical protein [Candidatus Latescibacterota bacterium]